MMLRKLLANKKIVIVAIAALLALIVGIVILVTSNSKEIGGKDTDTRTEQSKGDADSKDDNGDNKGNGSTELEVLEPDEVAPEDSSNVSGSWGDTPDSNTLTGNTNTTDKTDKTENKAPNEVKEDDGEEPKKDEDILEDDITWGNVY